MGYYFELKPDMANRNTYREYYKSYYKKEIMDLKKEGVM